MGQTVLQLDQLTQSVRGASEAREERLTALLNAAAGIDPRCSGMCGAIATIRPRPSNTPHE